MQMTIIHSATHLKVVHQTKKPTKGCRLQVVYRKEEAPLLFLTIA
ncbi:hypothetical protein [Nonlabens sp. YIK11]|nr:hypothetical protein [Nonlabens sp. YIK11]